MESVDVATVHFHGECAPPFVQVVHASRLTLVIGRFIMSLKQASLGLAMQYRCVCNLFSVGSECDVFNAYTRTYNARVLESERTHHIWLRVRVCVRSTVFSEGTNTNEMHATWHTYKRTSLRFRLTSVLCIGRTANEPNEEADRKNEEWGRFDVVCYLPSAFNIHRCGARKRDNQYRWLQLYW